MMFEYDDASFRDPSGNIFKKDNIIYRQINFCYQDQYEKLMSSGLYERLSIRHYLVSHAEVQEVAWISALQCFKIIQPEKIPFISYPYEWAFGQLKDAALTTLKIHRVSLDYNMILKDASAYNIQFIKGKALLIDTLSFDFYKENSPWVAYGQFCRHFLAPLLLMSYVDIRLSKFLTNFIDGVPLDLAASLLKGKGGLFAKQHIVWHARASANHGRDGRNNAVKKVHISKNNHIALIDSLIRGVEKLQLKNIRTEWGDYYCHTNYSEEALAEKNHIVESMLAKCAPKTVWDLGANDGRFSKLALNHAQSVVAYDIDLIAVEKNYQAVKKEKIEMLPLSLDLTNPSPAIGFANRERVSLSARQNPDCIMALAVIHHLAISNNLPFYKIAEWFASLSKHMVIEFVPKEDEQVQILLKTREDIFDDYCVENFEKCFLRFYNILDKVEIQHSQRILFLMQSK